jgi:Epoxide hydrolase N terminus
MSAKLPPASARAATTSEEIRPFRIEVPEADLVDLRRRIVATRWPERETVTDGSQGVPLAMMQDLARYWAKDYDWRKCEATLNALPQFMTAIDGLDIHFIHVRSKHENALPMIVTHGWPGSVVEQLKIIDPLTNPTAHGASASDAFTSTFLRPSQPRSPRRFSAAIRCRSLCRATKNAPTNSSRSSIRSDVLTPRSWGRARKRCVAWRIHPSGWQPGLLTMVTVGPSRRRRSPSAVLGRTVNGHPAGALTRDDVLDDITLYWLTNTAISSARLYWENKVGLYNAAKISVPAAVSVFPGENYEAPWSWAERAYHKLIYFNTLDKGGHYFVEEVRAGLRPVRT